jgi:hypothetical protein
LSFQLPPRNTRFEPTIAALFVSKELQQIFSYAKN